MRALETMLSRAQSEAPSIRWHLGRMLQNSIASKAILVSLEAVTQQRRHCPPCLTVILDMVSQVHTDLSSLQQ